MDNVEFQCNNCQAGLRIRIADQDKLIRCPGCQSLQRFAGPNLQSSGQVNPPPNVAPNDLWSVKSSNGQEFLNIHRSEFEEMIRSGQLGDDAMFIGGSHHTWTPLHRLFQSTTGKPQSSSYSPTPLSSGYRNASPPPLPFEAQLPNGNAWLVLILGIVGLFTFCLPLCAIIGLVIGMLDLARMGNGDISNRQNTTLTIGIFICIIGLCLTACFFLQFLV